MAMRNIVTKEQELLRKKSRPVEKFDEKLAQLVEDMIETMNEADGVGLDAPQGGLLRRVVVIDVGEGPMELVNPEILSREGEDLFARCVCHELDHLDGVLFVDKASQILTKEELAELIAQQEGEEGEQ